MSGPLPPSQMDDPAGLARWLAAALQAEKVHIEHAGAPPLNGASNDTLMVRASWMVSGEARTGGFVVRRPPIGKSLYHRYDPPGQYATMAALASTDVPVPPLIGYEPDPALLGAPFYLMEEVTGDAPPDLPPYTQVGWVLTLTAAQQARMYEASIAMLARVHASTSGASTSGTCATGPPGGFTVNRPGFDGRWFLPAVAGASSADCVRTTSMSRPRASPTARHPA